MVKRTLNFKHVNNVVFLGYMNRIIEKFGKNYKVLHLKAYGANVNAEIEVSK